MIELDGTTLRFAFPEVHADAVLEVSLQRTLRVPEDGTEYEMPSSIGTCRFVHIDDHNARVPRSWLQRGGVMTPLYSGETVRLGFYSPTVDGYTTNWRFLVLVGTGKINALTGATLQPLPDFGVQDYLVAPDQHELYGFCDADGLVRQFTATPQGIGASVEEQLTGEQTYGGMQLAVFPMTREAFTTFFEEKRIENLDYRDRDIRFSLCAPPVHSFNLGIGVGGLIRQFAREDRYGRDAWAVQVKSRCFVHLANASIWRQLTGLNPHPRPSLSPSCEPAPQDVGRRGSPGSSWFGRLKSLFHFGGNKLDGVRQVRAAAEPSPPASDAGASTQQQDFASDKRE